MIKTIFMATGFVALLVAGDVAAKRVLSGNGTSLTGTAVEVPLTVTDIALAKG